MAARENQGLQIALIIFVILTIILIVTTYLFFSSFSSEREKAKALEASNSTKEQAARTALAETEAFKNLIGAGQNESQEAIREATTRLVADHGPGLVESKRNYRALVEHLVAELKKKEATNTDLAKQVKDLNDQLATNDKAAKAEVVEYTTKLESTTSDLQGERKTFDKDRTELTGTKEKLAADFEAKNKEREEALRATSDQIAKVTTQRDDAVKQIVTINKERQEREKDSASPDGKVTRVDQRQRLIWINLGTGDGLRRQTSFKVYNAEDANPKEAKKKGLIEVVKITGLHEAEARIVEDDLSDPILINDKIFSVAWEALRPEHFALAGRMDLDGDGASDRQRIRDLITLNGGIIDAELTDEGEKTGSMTISTKYLVLGETPSNESANLDGYSQIRAEAAKLGVRTVDINTFLDYLGYQEQDRTVGLGKNAKGSDFKPRAPGGVQRTMPGNSPAKDQRKPNGAPRSIRF